MVEIHTIGSAPLVEALTEKLLQDARADGTALRTAEPGEFTKRAFLNGRIDMVQAEAVLRVIRSRTDSELRAAASQLEGGFSRELKKTHGRITDLLSMLEEYSEAVVLDAALTKEGKVGEVVEVDWPSLVDFF